jgi:3-deoxy-manno-octulosonate cytidylyltransferase (CMP-KDO synthetase)
MVERVVERVRRAKLVSRVVVATDDARIAAAVQAFGGEALMTRAEHHSGTERMAEVAARIAADVYVNVQGDEPLIEPAAIDAAVKAVTANKSVRVSTLSTPLRRAEDIIDPHVVKVVTDLDGNALYFSRAPIPWVRDAEERAVSSGQYQKHIGLYVFRRETLRKFPALRRGALERLERLEQLRLLENGIAIRVVETPYDAVSVDTPEDIPRVEQLIRRR